MPFDPDLTACAALVERADPDRFRAAMAAPVAARRVLFPLYAMNVEVARAPWVTTEPMIAEMRLQWWRDGLAEIASGAPVRRHEVLTPLAGVLAGETAARLDGLIAARRWDIHSDPFEDAAHFRQYIDQTSGTLIWAAATTLGAAEDAALRDIGFASGLANWFRAIPELEARGRIPLVDGTAEGIRDLADQGLAALARARGRIRGPARAALLSTWQAWPILRQARAAPGRVGAGALGTSEARQRLGLIWQAVRL